MAAEAVLTLTQMPRPAASAGPSSGCAGAPTAASSPSKSTSGTADGGLAGANASASQIAQPAADGSATSSRSAAATSDPPSAKPSGRSGPAQSGNPATDSESGRPEATPAKPERAASAASSAPAAQDAAHTAAATANFSAALAQSLAASPAAQAAQAAQAGQAESAATPAKPSGNATGRCEADDSSEPPAKHSAADPVSSALTLLQNALAGAVLGVPAVLTATVASTGASGASSQDGHIGAGSSAAAALNTLLAQNSATDLKSTVSTSPSAAGSSAAGSSATGPATAAPPAAATNAAATALTSLPLTAGSAVAAQHTKPDPTAMALSSPVGSSAWTDELGAKLTWMAGQGIESASLRLSPEHLGPLQVSISVHDGQASVWFGAAQPDTRTALQQSLPQLRLLFANQGLTLADAGVSREPPRGQTRRQPAPTGTATASVAAVNLEGAAGPGSIAGGFGLLDTYV
jgi:flagellar hook-length control protein FliK